MKLWSGYSQAPFADNTNNRNGNSSRIKAIGLHGRVSIRVKALTTRKGVFFVILVLTVVAITTKAMQSAATSGVSTAFTAAKAGHATVAEPFIFGMEEPWGDGSWGYPKAADQSTNKRSLKSLRGSSGSLSADASAAINNNLNKAI